MRYYLAGPMTGLPYFNFPAFRQAAALLRSLGYDIISPVELDDAAITAVAEADPTGTAHAGSWAEFLSRDVRVLVDQTNAIVVLPGWHESRGASLEVFTAMVCGFPLYKYSPGFDGAMVPMSYTEASRALMEMVKVSPISVAMTSMEKVRKAG